MKGIIAKVWEARNDVKLTLTQVRHRLKQHLLARAKRPPNRRTNYLPILIGEPGIGKTTTLRAIAGDLGWGPSELMHLNTAAFEDFTGLPIVVEEKVGGQVHKVAKFAKANFVPGAVWKDHQRVGIFDELPTAPPNVQCILREMIDGQLNGEQLDPNCLHVATGNPPEARFTTVNAVDEAIEDRLAPYVVVPTAAELLQIWSRIMYDLVYQFLALNPSVIVSAEGATAISPRRWMTVAEQVQDLVEAGERAAIIVQDVQGIFAEHRNVLTMLRQFIEHGNDPLKLPILGRDLIFADEEKMKGYEARMAHWFKSETSGFVGESKNDLIRVMATLTPEDKKRVDTISTNVARFIELLVEGKCIDMAHNLMEVIYSGTLCDDIMAKLKDKKALDDMTDKYQEFRRDVDAGTMKKKHRRKKARAS